MQYRKIVKFWLLLGLVLLFFQIVIGGITRITGSGLSITKWEIVTGTLPPLTEKSWNEAFSLYKTTPQYKKINTGMELGSIFDSKSFKFIYFWEYFHRLWARTMGFIFVFPLIFFVIKKWVDRPLLKQLSLVFLGALFAALFGWIMVASGLVNRPWVNAYKLSLHLGIALLTYSFLIWAIYKVFIPPEKKVHNSGLRKWSLVFLSLLCLQIFFGAIISGMKASLYYPTWPDIGGSFLPDVLLDRSYWTLDNILNYDGSPLMPALIHVLHRNLGYIVYAIGIYLTVRIFKYPLQKIFYKNNILLIVLLNCQVLLGILVLINSKGTIPVFFGVMHQAIAIFILSCGLLNIYLFRKR